MTKQALSLQLSPHMISMLERVMDHHDRSKLTRNQIAETVALKGLLRDTRRKLNLMARSEVLRSTDLFDIYPHPDHRDADRVMVYDRNRAELHSDTPFTSISEDAEIASWLSRGASPA